MRSERGKKPRIQLKALLAGLLLVTSSSQAKESPEVIEGLLATPTQEAARVLDPALYAYQLFELPLAEIERQVRDQGRVRLFLGDRSLDLALEANDLRAADYQAIVMRDGVAVEFEHPANGTFEGHVIGEPESLVRLTVRSDVFEGYIRTEKDWIFIDALPPVMQPPGTVVVYRDQDMRLTAAGGCGSVAGSERSEETTVPWSSSGVQKAVTMAILELATDADAEFVAARGGVSGAFGRIASILNGVDGIFRSDLDLDLVISGQVAWVNAGQDPYHSTSATGLLSEFGNYWNPNFPWIERDAAHLFTGKDLDGSVIGYAHIGTLCRSPLLAYGLSQNYSPSWSPLNLAIKLTAHELGHNLSAIHIEDFPKCSGSNACNGVENTDCEEFAPIMCAALNSDSNMSFTDCTQCGISRYINTHGSCMTGGVAP